MVPEPAESETGWPEPVWPKTVGYVELRGEEAIPTLRQWLEQLPGQPGFAGAELLDSPAQPGLALLASRWTGALPELTPPAGAKHWTFRVLEGR